MKTLIALLGILLFSVQPAWALDSYRYAHVTIETPWMIFLFLLVIVLAPFILILVFRRKKRLSERVIRAQVVATYLRVYFMCIQPLKYRFSKQVKNGYYVMILLRLLV